MASWILSLSDYSLWSQAQAPPSTAQFMDLECVVSETTGARHALSLVYDATNTDILQGNVVETGAGYEIYIDTNSFELVQQILWVLALPNNIAKTVQVTGSPAPTIAGYTIDAFAVYSSPAEPTLAVAGGAPPQEMRKRLERRRERQAGYVNPAYETTQRS